MSRSRGNMARSPCRSRLGLKIKCLGFIPYLFYKPISTAFCFIAKLHVHHFECKASILFTDSQAKVLFTSLFMHTFAIAKQYTIQKVHLLDFANAKSLTTSSKSTEWSMSASMQSRDRVQSLLTHRCSVWVLDSSEYSVQALMVSVALYCLLCIILQHSNIIYFCFF